MKKGIVTVLVLIALIFCNVDSFAQNRQYHRHSVHHYHHGYHRNYHRYHHGHAYRGHYRGRPHGNVYHRHTTVVRHRH